MSRIITGLLALLGFVGCDTIGKEMYGPARVEYGSPHADFEIKGRVTDRAGDPISDIKIAVSSDEWIDPPLEVGVGKTNGEGYFSVTGGWFGGSELSVVAEDIDGAENGGEFAGQAKELKIESGDYVGGENWYRGKVTKTADFTLTLKPQEDENE